MTLLEVLIALAILATVLGYVLVARGRLLTMRIVTDERMRSAAAAEKLMNDWWLKDGRIPVNASGTTGDSHKVHWETRRVGHVTEAEDLDIVRLSVASSFRAAGTSVQAVAVVVDVVQPQRDDFPDPVRTERTISSKAGGD